MKTKTSISGWQSASRTMVIFSQAFAFFFALFAYTPRRFWTQFYYFMMNKTIYYHGLEGKRPLCERTGMRESPKSLSIFIQILVV
jgi:hypothetical protein